MRAFISINIDDTTKDKILDIQNKVKAQIAEINEKFLKSISWTGKDKFHLTLFFIGEVNENRLSEVDSCLSNLQSGLHLNEIKFEFGCINAFPKLRYPRVLIIELLNKHEKIFELTKKINDTLKTIGLINDKLFHPHITLGRIKREHKINLSGLENKIEFDLSFNVNEFFLMESKLKSQGAEYSVLKRWSIVNSE